MIRTLETFCQELNMIGILLSIICVIGMMMVLSVYHYYLSSTMRCFLKVFFFGLVISGELYLASGTTKLILLLTTHFSKNKKNEMIV